MPRILGISLLRTLRYQYWGGVRFIKTTHWPQTTLLYATTSVILSPPAIEAALVLLKDNEFPVKEYASLGVIGEFTKQVLDFKTKHSVQGFTLRLSSLQQLGACTGGNAPSSQAHKFAEELKIRHLANPDSLSYAPVSLFELTAAPRILLASRFAASMMRMAKAVTALVVKHDAVIAARVGAKEKLVDMQDELVGVSVY